MANENAKTLRVGIEATSNVPQVAQESADGLNQVTDGTKKAKEATEEHNKAGRAQYLLFSEINKIMPGLGHEIHAAFTGPIAPILLLTIAIAEVHAKLKEFNAEMDKQAAAAADPTFLDAMNGRMEVARSAMDAAIAYADAIDNAAVSESKLVDKLKQQFEVSQAIERAQAGLTSAQKEAEIARIQTQESQGVLTHEEAAEKKAEIEKKYIQQAADEKDAFDKKQIDQHEAAAKQLADRQAELDQNLSDARAKLEKDEAHRKAVSLPADFDKQIKDAQKALDDAEASRDRDMPIAKAIQAGHPELGNYAERVNSYIQNQVDNATNKRNELMTLQRQFDDDKSKGNFQSDRDAADSAKRAAEENRKAADEFKNEADKLKAVLDATRSITQQTTAAKSQTAGEQENKRVVDDFKKGAQFLQRFDTSDSASPLMVAQAAQTVKDLQSILKTHTDLLKQLVELKPALDALKQAQAILASQNSKSGNNSLTQ